MLKCVARHILLLSNIFWVMSALEEANEARSADLAMIISPRVGYVKSPFIQQAEARMK